MQWYHWQCHQQTHDADANASDSGVKWSKMIMIMQIYIAHWENGTFYLLHFTHVLLKPLLHTVSFLIEGEPPPPRSTPWGAYRPAISHGAVPFCHSAYSMWYSLTHSPMVDRRTVVGHVLMDHMCSFMCTSHIDITIHNPTFLWVG